MEKISAEQIRQFRLHTHHLDKWYPRSHVADAAGACGFQNSPPGTWESALHSRIPDLTTSEMQQMLETDKILLQAWSIRGVPVVFPTGQSDVFLTPLVPQQEEPWIYTKGIGLALDYLDMPFDVLLAMLLETIAGLDGEEILSKTALDQTLAAWMLPLLPGNKRPLWNSPSMYGNPAKQTVGGAVVSFLLRPCSFMGRVVFGKREGIHPTYTSYRNWLGHDLQAAEDTEKKLVRKYLHCYGPSTQGGFANWLGCSPAQAKRLWFTAADEMEPVQVNGKTRCILAADKVHLCEPPKPERNIHLLSARDPYLGLQDRSVVLRDKDKQRIVWQTVSNPGTVLMDGRITGMWKPRKKGKTLEIEVVLWENTDAQRDLRELCESYAAFRGQKLNKVTFLT